MIAWFLIYCFWLIAYYSLWAGDTVTDKVIYYAFLFGWLSAGAILSLVRERAHKVAYIFVAVFFACLMVYELSCFDMEAMQYKEAVNMPGPTYTLAFIGIGLFILFEIIQWKKRRSASRGRI